MEIEIDKKSLAVVHAAADCDSRFALRNVQIMDNGMTTATNTHVLFQVIPPDAKKLKRNAKEVLIDSRTLKKTLRTFATKPEIKKDATLRKIKIKRVKPDDETALVTTRTADAEIHNTVKTDGGVFPKGIKDIVDFAIEKNVHHKFKLSVDVIGALYQTLKTFHDSEYNSFKNVMLHVSDDASEPVYIESKAEDGHVLRVVLMPIRENQ